VVDLRGQDDDPCKEQDGRDREQAEETGVSDNVFVNVYFSIKPCQAPLRVEFATGKSGHRLERSRRQNRHDSAETSPKHGGCRHWDDNHHA